MADTLPSSNKETFFTSVFRGLVILVPLLAFYFLFRLLFTQIANGVNKVLVSTNLNERWQVWAVFMSSLGCLILIAYIVGHLSKTEAIKKISKRIDQELIDRFSIYRDFKLNIDNTMEFRMEKKKPVFVKSGSDEVPAFIMEEYPEQQKCVVFIPSNFRSFSGSVHITPMENIRYAKISDADLIYALQHLGDGLDIS